MSATAHLDFLPLPDKDVLVKAYKGTKIDKLRTPALIIDQGVFKRNCDRVTQVAYDRGLLFRSHVKTHKTLEGVRLQLTAGQGVKSVVCSTLPEMWPLIPLVEEGLLTDMLYSLPVGAGKLPELDALQKTVRDKAEIRLMVDNEAQIKVLEAYNKDTGRTKPWTVFVKVDGGGRRAGAPPKSPQMKALIEAINSTDAVEIHGFYSHFGQSYASKDLSKATDYFNGEVECVNSAASFARGLGAKGDWVLSVGATPTAHAATQNDGVDSKGLEGKLELHAGCYCLCDLQQFATGIVPAENLALTVTSSVVSLYPDRQEAMCDCGALAVSKDTGPFAGYGHIISPPNATGWSLGRISQEHGTLVHRDDLPEDKIEPVKIGDVVRIIPQHACLVCASHPWIYIVDGGDEVVDVWVPWKAW